MRVQVDLRISECGARAKEICLDIAQDEYGLSIKADQASHLGNPDWYVELRGHLGEPSELEALDPEQEGSGQNLVIQLAPGEVERIVRFALKHGLVKA